MVVLFLFLVTVFLVFELSVIVDIFCLFSIVLCLFVVIFALLCGCNTSFGDCLVSPDVLFCVCVCVCVCERERERERVFVVVLCLFQ